jgi:hypothetical protein
MKPATSKCYNIVIGFIMRKYMNKRTEGIMKNQEAVTGI